MFKIYSVKDIVNVIIPHFEKHPLITQKKADFELFRGIIELIWSKEHLNKEGLVKIINLRASLNKGLNAKLAKAFPLTVPVTRPFVENLPNLNPNWIAGFTSGEGCFHISLVKNKLYEKTFVQLWFVINQHNRDSNIIKAIMEYLSCGNIKVRTDEEAVELRRGKFEDIFTKIIPFFDEYTILGDKSLDYAYFKQAAFLIKAKAHLTDEGVEQIRCLKSRMNTNRKYN